MEPVKLDAFFDDAALFPPGNAPMAEAVNAHLKRRVTPDGAYVGPFVCLAERLDELAAALDGDRMDVAVVGVPTLPLPAGTVLAAVELRGPVDLLPDLPADVRIFVEQPWGSGFDIPAGSTLKLRCGGAVVPTIGELGGAIAHCVEHALPFKLTAGLHHAVVSDTGHGFVNVLAAVDAALAGEEPVPVLAQRDPEALVVRDPGAVRRLFLSIGTCDIDQPLTDLRALGWLA